MIRNRIVRVVGSSLLATMLLAPQAFAEQEIYLGREGDACSGSLSVKDKNGNYVAIMRGVKQAVDVAISGDGYWYWKCGSSKERSRGSANYRQRVKRLYVSHSTEGRAINWQCYDVLP